MKKVVLLIMIAICLATATASLYDFTDTLGQTASIEVEYWTGTGDYEALLVIDWNQAGAYSTASHAFGYRWDGSAKTVAAMLSEIATGSLDTIIESASFGDYIGDLIYNGSDGDLHTHDEYGSWNVASTGDIYSQWGLSNETWTKFGGWDAGYGINSDTIAPGRIEGINAVYFYDQNKVSQFLNIPFATPEPATMALLALGGLMIPRKK